MTSTFGPFIAQSPMTGDVAGGDAGRVPSWSHSSWWRGVDQRDGRPVALAVFAAADADVVERAAAAADDVRDPHLLCLDDVVESDGLIALVSPWPGVTLRWLLCRRGRLLPGEIVTGLAPIASALAAVHAAGLVHGSVGSAAVWLHADGRPTLAGLAAALAERELGGTLPGAVPDLAPEVARRRGVGPASDVFALGSVALQCLTGRPAWPADEPADVLVQSAAGQWPAAGPADGPADLVTAIRRMLDQVAGRRPATAVIPGLLRAVGPPAPIDLNGPAMAVLPVAGGAPAPETGSHSADRSRDRQNPAGPAAGGAHPAAPGADRAALAARAVRGERAMREPAASGAAAAAGSDSHTTDTTDAAGAGDEAASRGPGRFRAWRASRRLPPARRHLLSGAAASTRPPRAATDPADDAAEAAAPRGRRRSRRPVGGWVAAALAMLVAVGAVAAGVRWGQPDPSDPSDQPAAAAAALSGTGVDGTAIDWTAVMIELDRRRAAAFLSADPTLLDQVYAPAAPGAAQDAATIAELARSGVRLSGAAHEILAVAMDVETGTAAGGTVISVRVRDALPHYAVLDANGATVGRTTARPAADRIVDLVPHDAAPGEFRITAIRST